MLYGLHSVLIVMPFNVFRDSLLFDLFMFIPSRSYYIFFIAQFILMIWKFSRIFLSGYIYLQPICTVILLTAPHCNVKIQ